MGRRDPRKPSTAQSFNRRWIPCPLHDRCAIEALSIRLEGNRLREIPLPAGLGLLPEGKEDDETLYYRFTNYATPSTIYALDPATGESRLHFRPSIAFNPDDYVSRQVFYASKDGTRVPMMITHLKDRDPLGQRRPSCMAMVALISRSVLALTARSASGCRWGAFMQCQTSEAAANTGKTGT